MMGITTDSVVHDELASGGVRHQERVPVTPASGVTALRHTKAKNRLRLASVPGVQGVPLAPRL